MHVSLLCVIWYKLLKELNQYLCNLVMLLETKIDFFFSLLKCISVQKTIDRYRTHSKDVAGENKKDTDENIQVLYLPSD